MDSGEDAGGSDIDAVTAFDIRFLGTDMIAKPEAVALSLLPVGIR